MSKTPLFCKVLLSSICGIFIISSGCWGSKDNDREVRSASAQAGASLKPITGRETPPAESAQSTRQPPAQLLTPAKQIELTPPIQESAGPSAPTADAPRIADTTFSLVAMEPAARYGDQAIAGDDEPVNPLRAPEQPAPGVPLESSFKPGDGPDASLPPKASFCDLTILGLPPNHQQIWSIAWAPLSRKTPLAERGELK